MNWWFGFRWPIHRMFYMFLAGDFKGYPMVHPKTLVRLLGPLVQWIIFRHGFAMVLPHFGSRCPNCGPWDPHDFHSHGCSRSFSQFCYGVMLIGFHPACSLATELSFENVVPGVIGLPGSEMKGVELQLSSQWVPVSQPSAGKCGEW